MEGVGVTEILQTGALGVFAWYAVQNNREWRLYLSERNSKLEKALDRLGTILEKHSDE
jgi:predicted component of type VI protein secretion system